MKAKRDVYLSVDLDYFYSDAVTGSGLDFVKELYSLNRPTTLFKHHQTILHDITKQYCLVDNVDYHSDIVEPECNRTITCANWVNHVYGRNKAVYQWRYPNREECITQGYGLCHLMDDHGQDHNPFYHPEWKLWSKVTRRYGLEGIDFGMVDRIAFILSPAWLRPLICYDALEFIRCHNKTRYFSQRTIKAFKTILNNPTKEWGRTE